MSEEILKLPVDCKGWNKISFDGIMPRRRIRVLVCDGIGFVQTAFYGHRSFPPYSIGWWSDKLPNEEIINKPVYWREFPEVPEDVKLKPFEL